MEKELFEKAFKDDLDKNFLKLSKYFDYNFYVFSELGSLVFEINKCLILELFRASITLTNHTLERLLKLALIYNESGIGPIPVEDWNSNFEKPNNEYGTYQLGNSIEKCRKLSLITEDEKDFLFKTIRVLMRNGFSHADSSEILKSLPDESIMFQGSFIEPGKLKEVKINQKVIPFMQALQLEDFAKDHALLYFNYVFELINKIDKRLVEKYK